jgi:hypothetical protein
MPKLYIEEFVGITNRLETLPLAFAIRKAHGHEIVLDWRELDSFRVDDTRRGTVNFISKIGADRVRDCNRATFDGLRGRKILLRSLDGPAEILDPVYMEIPAKIHLKTSIAEEIKKTFAPLAGRPVVGVHIRHGDFHVVDQDSYRIEGVEWPAVPVWWYEKTMARIVRNNKEACFFLACTGDPDTHGTLTKNFDIVTLPVASHYSYKNEGSDHQSSVNPVADLFALACCPVVLATPISGYSHWAANVLGIPAMCIVPIPGATLDNPAAGTIHIFGSRLPRWRRAGRSGDDVTVIENDGSDLDVSQSADTGWL